MLLAVQLRADAVEIFEGLGEGQGVVVADLTGDLLDRVIGLDQEVDRLLQFTLDQVLLR